jgi:hypothetical protein
VVHSIRARRVDWNGDNARIETPEESFYEIKPGRIDQDRALVAEAQGPEVGGNRPGPSVKLAEAQAQLSPLSFGQECECYLVMLTRSPPAQDVGDCFKSFNPI